MEPREIKGLEIAAKTKLTRKGKSNTLRSHSVRSGIRNRRDTRSRGCLGDKVSDKTILCDKGKITVADYRKMIKQQERPALVSLIRDRFTERYIRPIEKIPNKAESKSEDFRNGFCTMAISCLMIEALASFWKGRPETPRGEGGKTFEWFFTQPQNTALADFKGYGARFYANVRCGILHQGETTRGWKIHRKGNLFAASKLTINATKFHGALAECLESYCKALEADHWDGPVWLAFKWKMDTLCRNCSVS